MDQNAERLKSIEKMTIEQYLEKYDKYIRGLIYKRADSDYSDDAYQEVVMQIIKYKDKLDSLDTDAARCAYICTITKRIAKPQKKINKKLKTYGDFVGSDIDDAKDPEEWFLEDNTYCPDNQPDLAKRAWAEDIIDTNEKLKNVVKILERKLAYAKTDDEKLRALKSIYAVELLQDNVEEMKARIRTIMLANGITGDCDDIIDINIQQGDFLKMTHADGTDIAFYDWRGGKGYHTLRSMLTKQTSLDFL